MVRPPVSSPRRRLRARPPRHAPSRAAIALLGVVSLLAGACGNVVHLQAGDPVTFVQQPQTSQVLAADGTVLAELHGEQDRREVSLDEVSDDLVKAVVAIEDRRFFVHAGVDGPAIVRAALKDVSSGAVEEGGSTLTQQYVKNTMTGADRTLKRKLKEAVLAYELEQRYSKQQILERYLNTVYFGRGAYGVDAAAQRYFGVDAGHLSLVEAAQLAGMIASPSRFDPFDHPDAAAARRGQVLDALVDTGQLTTAQADAARGADLPLSTAQDTDHVRAPYFVDEVKRRLQHDPDGRFAVLGSDVDARADRLFTGGLKIVTTLDPSAQSAAEHAVGSVLTDQADPSAALVATDPTTGAVRALVGGRDFYGDDPHAQFNLATQGRRQPGSSFKPVVLATALSRGVSLDRMFPGGDCVAFPQIPGWEQGVCNYAHIAYPSMTLRQATVDSVNTVYARLSVEVGPSAIVDEAHTLGFTDVNDPVYSIALGSEEVSPLEMAGGYGTFANGGTYHAPYLIARIEAPDGTVLYRHDDTGTKALDPAVAYLVTQALQDVVARGTGVRAQIDRPQAGKTGTSQDSADAWFVGYTPDLVASVWVGFPSGRIPMVPPRTRALVEGGRWPAEIWHAFATQALAGSPKVDFQAPDVNLVHVKVDVTRNCLPNPYTPPDLIETRDFLAGTAPTEQCSEPSGPPVDDVPSVVGLPKDVAARLLRDQGFGVDVREVASPRFPSGIVAKQRPDPGGTTREQDDNAVVIWVATAASGRARIPSVVGLKGDDAVRALEADGWVPTVEEGCPPEGCAGMQRGEVWGQAPKAGTDTRPHSEITLLVSPSSRR